MGVYVGNAPIRLWVDPDYLEDETDCVSKVKVLDRDVQYVRADIVEEMREALEFCCELLESLGSTALRGRSAIKLLEEG